MGRIGGILAAMRTPTIVAAAVAVALALACGAPPPDPNAPHAVAEAPAAFGRTIVAARKRLGKTPQMRCGTGSHQFTWRAEGTFLAATPKAKFSGNWKVVDDDIVYITDGPATTCSSARFLLDEAGTPAALLCAEAPVGCDTEMDWAMEVVDAGGGAESAALIAGAATGIGAEYGSGLVFAGKPQRGSEGLSVRFRNNDGPARRLAEHVALILERDLRTADNQPVRVSVANDPEASSPVVIRVGSPLRAAVAPGG